MSHPRIRRRSPLAGAFALAGLAALPLGARAQATTLSDNLSNATYDIEAVTGSTWAASSFGTDASAYTLDSVTLLLEESSAGTATLDIYSDGGLQPGSLVGTLTASTAYSTTTLSDTTFTASGITLAADTTYWAVLQSSAGEFDWSYTADNTGGGAGFQDQWAESDDAGATWFDYDTDPTQMQVVATAVAAPEPSPAVALPLGAALLGAAIFVRRRNARA